MKVLLVAVNAKYIHSNLAVYSLKTYADQVTNGLADIKIKEYTINQNLEQTLWDIYNEKPDVLAFSCYIWNIEYIYSIIKSYKKINSKTHIWLGGPEVSYRAKDVLNELNIVGIITGEGEIPFSMLVKVYLEAGSYINDYEYYDYECIEENLSNVNGIVTKNIDNPNPALISMDELPFVYDKLSIDDFENRIPYYETMRGCPFSCSYCLSSIDKSIRFRSLELVKRELQFFIDHKVKQVKFVDRTFNCKPEHAMTIWQYIIDHDNDITNFHFEVAADVMTEEELSLLSRMRPGLIQLEVGVQTTNTNTINAINRVMDFNKVARVSNTIRSNNNIHLHLDLIAGLPEEDFNSFKNSFNMVYSLRPHELQLGFLKVLHGTKIEETAKEGHITYWDSPAYEVLCTDWISYEEIRALKNVEEMLEIYYNSCQFINSIPYLEAFFDTPFDMYYALAEYYDKNNLLVIQSSRIKKYEILLSFAKDYNTATTKYTDNYSEQINTEILKEALLIDLYSRENLKKRPDFAEEPKDTYYNKLHDFYLKELESPKYLTCGYNGYDLKMLMRSTHIEHIKHLHGKEEFLLFDYNKKDPVTGNIAYYNITNIMI